MAPTSRSALDSFQDYQFFLIYDPIFQFALRVFGGDGRAAFMAAGTHFHFNREQSETAFIIYNDILKQSQTRNLNRE